MAVQMFEGCAQRRLSFQPALRTRMPMILAWLSLVLAGAALPLVCSWFIEMSFGICHGFALLLSGRLHQKLREELHGTTWFGHLWNVQVRKSLISPIGAIGLEQESSA